MRSARAIAGVALAAALVAGCGGTQPTSGNGTSGSPNSTAGATQQPGTASGIPAVCLDEATISNLVGFAVVFERSTLKTSAQAVNCTFPAADQTAYAGVNVAILVAPASYAQQAIDDITSSAQQAGAATTPVDVGKDGLSYGSTQRSAAATVVGSQLIGVTIGTSGLSSLGDKRLAAVDVLRKVAQKLGTR